MDELYSVHIFACFYATGNAVRLFRSPVIQLHCTTLKDALLKVVERVEGQGREELRTSERALIYLGWTQNPSHYVYLFVSYNPMQNVYNNECPDEIIIPYGFY